MTTSENFLSQEVCKRIHPRKYLKDYLLSGVRPVDNRKLFSYRPVIGNVNVIENCCGSSFVKIGNTSVVCGIQHEVTTPSKKHPGKGLVDINCKLSDHCNVQFPHRVRIVQLKQCTNLLQKLFIGLKVLDLESLCIAKGELVWLLKAYVICLDYDGAFWDAAALALFLALKSTKLPQIEYSFDSKAFVYTEQSSPLPIQRFPLCTSYGVFLDFVIADPNFEEEQLCTSFVIVVSEADEIKMIQKRGGTKITDKQMFDCIEMSINRYKMLESVVETILNQKNNSEGKLSQ